MLRGNIKSPRIRERYTTGSRCRLAADRRERQIYRPRFPIIQCVGAKQFYWSAAQIAGIRLGKVQSHTTGETSTRL